MTHTDRTRMHVSLNTSRLDASVAFYSALFGVAPTKQRADWAKFTLADPPLVLSLNASAAARDAAGTGRLSHLGFQLAGDAEVAAMRARVEAAGIPITLDEPGVTCCYAVQNKFWVTDPDGNAWEFYRFVEDATVHSRPERERGEAREAAAVPAATGGACCGPTGCC